MDYWSARPSAGSPDEDDLEPLHLGMWQQGRAVTAGAYLMAIMDLQAFARVVAGFFARYDVWLTPTLAAPPLPLGAMTSTRDDPWRAARVGGPFVAFPAIVANITGAPAMSVPLHWSPAGLPIGVHALGPTGADGSLFALAGQLERARPWAHRWPAEKIAIPLGRPDGACCGGVDQVHPLMPGMPGGGVSRMASQRWAVAGMTSLALLLLGVGAGVPALAGTAKPAGPAAGHRTGCSAGAHTLAPHGSHLYPDTGNGGYTSLHTDVHLVYDAASNRFLAGNHVTLTDRATQCLTSFSLDFERRSVNATAGPDMTVRSVWVNGHPASLRFVQPTYPGDPNGQDDPNPLAHEASQVNPVGGPHHNPLPPACSPELTSTNPAKKSSKNGTQCPANKLVITPPAPIGTGSTFRVTVAYTGRPGVHNDGDGTTEGWFRSNQPKGDGGFVTTEPVGTEDWMPLNDYPTAKPTYDFYDTVNAGKTVLANGMLESRQPHPASAQFPHGSVTWHWHSAAPVASYLVEDSVGQLRPDPADRAAGSSSTRPRPAR